MEIYTLHKLASRNEARIQHTFHTFYFGEVQRRLSHSWLGHAYRVYQPRKSRKSSFRESKNWLCERQEEREIGEIRKKGENRSNKRRWVEVALEERETETDRKREKEGMFATKRQAVNKVANSPGRRRRRRRMRRRRGGLRPFIFLQNLCSSHLRHPLVPPSPFWASPRLKRLPPPPLLSSLSSPSSSSSLDPARVALTRRRDFHTIVCIETNRSREPREIRTILLYIYTTAFFTDRERERDKDLCLYTDLFAE